MSGSGGGWKHVSLVEALREPGEVTFLALSKPSAAEPVPPEELAALPRLGELTRLEVLVARNIAGAWPSFAPLRALRRITLSGAGLHALPDGLATLPALETLELDENPGLDLAATCAALAGAPALRVLRLGHRGLDALPPEIAALSQVETVILDAGVAAAAAGLAAMPGLRRLLLTPAKKQDATLGAAIAALAAAPKLQALHLGGFKLADRLPDEVTRLAALEDLRAPSWELIELPASLAGMTALRSISINGKKIKAAYRKAIETAMPSARFAWDGGFTAWHATPIDPPVRRVPEGDGLSPYERMWGRRLPAPLTADPPDANLDAPAGTDTFAWLVAAEQQGPRLHLFPFFADLAPLPESLPDGDVLYGHVAGDGPVEFYRWLHDDADPLALVPIGDVMGVDRLWKLVDAGKPLTVVEVPATSRVPALLARSRWILDLLSGLATEAAVVAPTTAPGDDATTADLLHALWGGYLAGRDDLVDASLPRASGHPSRVVRDAAARLTKIRSGDAAARSLGSIADVAVLRRPAP